MITGHAYFTQAEAEVSDFGWKIIEFTKIRELGAMREIYSNYSNYYVIFSFI